MTEFVGELGLTGLTREHPRPYPYIPNLAILDTGELFDHIPKNGAWKLPRPYDMDDMQRFMVTASIPAFQEKWDGLLGEWVHYLNQVEDGLKIYQRVRRQHIVQGSEVSFNAYLYFERAGIAATKDNIHSVRRAFLGLLSPKAREKLTVKDPVRVSKKDIKNARKVVRNFEHTIPALPPWTDDDD